jgi:transposase
MLPLTPPSRLVVATDPGACRNGLDGLGAVCRQRLGDTPFEGAIYVFRTRSGTALTRLLYDGPGSWLCMNRRSHGRCRWWPTTADARGPGAARAWLIGLWHGDPARAPMARAGRRVASGGARAAWSVQGNHAAGAAQTAARCSGRATHSAPTLPPAARQGMSQRGRTLAREALDALWENSEGVRGRMKRVQARSPRWVASGAPGPDTKRGSVSPWPCLEAIAWPTERLGSTRRSSTGLASQPWRAAISGPRASWWYTKRACGLLGWARASASWSKTCVSTSRPP